MNSQDPTAVLPAQPNAEAAPSVPQGAPAAAPRMLLWLVAIGFFMQSLDATIVNTALPSMAASLGADPLRMQGVVVAYALAMAMLIPASGWLADRFGTRRVFMAAIAVFTAGSVWCALSPSLGWLIAARVLQGLGGALLMPVGRLAVLRAFPGPQFLKALNFVLIPGLIGPLMGPSLGGWLVEVASWHWIFWVNVPVGVVGLLATLRWMPHSPTLAVRRFDWGGYTLLALGMVGVCLSLEAMAHGAELPMAWSVGVLATGLVCLLAYAWHARRSTVPLFAPSLFAHRILRVGLLGNLLARLGCMSTPFLLPLFYQVCLGIPPLQAGMMMLPIVLASMVVKRITNRAVSRWGYRHVLMVNTVLLGASIAVFAAVTPATPLWVLVLLAMWHGGSNSMQFSAMNAVTLRNLSPDMASSGNTLLSMVQMLAMSVGVAAAAAVLAGFSALWPSSSAMGGLAAFHATFWVMGGMTVVATLVFAQLPAKAVLMAPMASDDKQK